MNKTLTEKSEMKGWVKVNRSNHQEHDLSWSWFMSRRTLGYCNCQIFVNGTCYQCEKTPYLV